MHVRPLGQELLFSVLLLASCVQARAAQADDVPPTRPIRRGGMAVQSFMFTRTDGLFGGVAVYVGQEGSLTIRHFRRFPKWTMEEARYSLSLSSMTIDSIRTAIAAYAATARGTKGIPAQGSDLTLITLEIRDSAGRVRVVRAGAELLADDNALIERLHALATPREGARELYRGPLLPDFVPPGFFWAINGREAVKVLEHCCHDIPDLGCEYAGNGRWCARSVGWSGTMNGKCGGNVCECADCPPPDPRSLTCSDCVLNEQTGIATRHCTKTSGGSIFDYEPFDVRCDCADCVDDPSGSGRLVRGCRTFGLPGFGDRWQLCKARACGPCIVTDADNPSLKWKKCYDRLYGQYLVPCTPLPGTGPFPD